MPTRPPSGAPGPATDEHRARTAHALPEKEKEQKTKTKTNNGGDARRPEWIDDARRGGVERKVGREGREWAEEGERREGREAR